MKQFFNRIRSLLIAIIFFAGVVVAGYFAYYYIFVERTDILAILFASVAFVSFVIATVFVYAFINQKNSVRIKEL